MTAFAWAGKQHWSLGTGENIAMVILYGVLA